MKGHLGHAKYTNIRKHNNKQQKNKEGQHLLIYLNVEVQIFVVL